MAWRNLMRRPGFTLTAVLVLALGAGVNAAIIGLVDGALLRPLAGVTEPGRLVWVMRTYGHSDRPRSMSYPEYLGFRDGAAPVAELATFDPAPVHLSSGGVSERLEGMLVSGNYFRVLGVQAAQGRTFLPDEDGTPLAHPVAVVSHRLWMRRFQASPALVGSTLTLNGHAFTVVGVAPAGFHGAELGHEADIFVPLAMQPWVSPLGGSLTSLESRGLRVVGRMREGTSEEGVLAALRVVSDRLAREHPRELEVSGVRVDRLRGRLHPADHGDALPVVALLAVVSGLILLIACANVANLQIARGASRRAELGVRVVLGASRGRLVGELLTESLLLSTAGSALGLLLSFWATDALLASMDAPASLDASPRAFHLAACAALAVGSGLLSGLLPALRTSQVRVAPVLSGVGVEGGRRASRVQDALVVGQLALSLLLLVTAGLFLQSLRKAAHISPGFEPAGVLTVSLDLGVQGYPEAERARFHEELLARVRRLPGVEAAALTQVVPLSGRVYGASLVQATAGDDVPGVRGAYAVVTPDYLSTLRIPLLQGRPLAARDVQGAPLVALVNETAARRLFAGELPLGQRFRLWEGGPELEVVGVVGDTRVDTLDEEPMPFVLLAAAQHPGDMAEASLLVRTRGEPHALLPQVRREVAALDADLPLFAERPLAEVVYARHLFRRHLSSLLGVCSALALVLAVVGLYGIVSYSVSRRTREFGIRMALGAREQDVTWQVVREAGRLVATGLGAGLLLSFGLTRLLERALFGLSATDAATFAGVSLLLAAVALVASWVPARRATRADPSDSLRAL